MQEDRISDREALIRELGAQHNIKGFDTSPLAKEKVVAFSDRLSDLQRQRTSEANKLEVSLVNELL